MARRVCAWVIMAALGFVGAAVAVTTNLDPPDSQENVVSGAIETADTPWSGTDYDIRHVSSPGAGQTPVIATLTSDIRNDLGARLAISSVSGDSWVAWWRDAVTDQVLVRKRSQATGAWSAERAQSVSSESSRRPSVAFDGSSAWIAFEVIGTGGATSFKAKHIDDDPAPFLAPTTVATTSYTGTVQARIQAESGHLWLSWIDSETEVGWSQYNPGTATWTVPAFESYASDSVDAALARVRSSILAN